jgi:hypothetical protein
MFFLVVLADPFQQVESKKDKRAKVSSQQSIISTRQMWQQQAP